MKIFIRSYKLPQKTIRDFRSWIDISIKMKNLNMFPFFFQKGQN